MREGHTPGPWYITREDHTYGDHPATTAGRLRIQTDGRSIAVLSFPDDTGNAALIAAAPDLLQIVKFFIAGIDCGSIETHEELTDFARRTVEKAEGLGEAMP